MPPPTRRRVALQKWLEDVTTALWPGACRHCGGALPERQPAPPPWAALQDGSLRRSLGGGLSLPLWLLCARCAMRLDPPPTPRPLAGAAPCVTAFGPGPELFALVHALKYGGQVELAGWFGDFLADAARRVWGEALVLVPVPLHPRRRRERGFNQSALLAYAVAARLGCSVAEDLLVRRRDTPPQARLEPDLRRANVDGAFAAAAGPPAVLRGARLVLVDDVVTTGATVAAAIAALPQDAAPRGVLALCRARAG